MDIYKIQVQHFSQKDSHTSIEAFVLAESAEAVYQWIDKEKQCGYFSDMEDDGEMCDIYDDDYNVIAQETFKEKMLRIGGQLYDEDYEPQDLYYGVTIYGWKKLDSNIPDVEISALKNIGILIEI